MMGRYLGCRIYLKKWVGVGTSKGGVLTNLNPLTLKKNWERIAFIVRSMDFTDLQSVIN